MTSQRGPGEAPAAPDLGDQLAVEERDGVEVVRVTGDVDAAVAPELHRRLTQRCGCPLVIDLNEVTYLDSSGIALVEAVRSTRPAVVVLRDASIVQRAFAITGLDRLIPVSEDLESALARLR